MARDLFRLVVKERLFARVVIGAVAFGFLLLVIAGLAATLLFTRNQDYADRVDHTHEVRAAIAEADSIAYRLEAGRRGLLLHDNPIMSDALKRNMEAIMPAARRIQQLTGDNPRQQRSARILADLSNRYRLVVQRSIDLIDAGQRPRAVAEFLADPKLELPLARRDQAAAMMAEETRLLAARDAERRRSAVIFYGVLAVTGLLLALVAILSLVAILRYNRDLTASRNGLRTMNENLEGAVRERTTDLQRANDEIQRFAYIVSHDLRSPLVNVMGFTAELEAASRQLGDYVERVAGEAPALADEGARLAAREDLPEAIGFIRTSTQKMDRLINAILRLSREGRRAIAPEPVDMVALAQLIADGLRHRVDDLGASIEVERPMPAIVTDRLAIEQILSNLVENSVKYLKPGRPGRIVISGHRAADGRVLFEVADNGRGIDPRDHERVFDLFRRSGPQDQPGEGIGLAHVRAMAYRLGGTIAVQSALDEGATFRLSLPSTYSAEQGSSA